MVWWEVSFRWGDTSSFLQERGDTGVRVYQDDVLQGVEKQLNMTRYSGQEWVFQQDSVPAQNPRRLRSGCGGTFWHLSAPRIGPRGVQTLNPRNHKLWAVLEVMACQKASQKPGQSEEIPRESSGRVSPGDGACHDSREAGASQGLRRGRGPPF